MLKEYEESLKGKTLEELEKISGYTIEQAREIILKKVEMIFGRPIKLSEITEDQVDLFNLAVLDMEDMLLNYK